MDLHYRHHKIQTKHTNTKFRDFIMEIASSYSLMFYKNDGLVSRFPNTDRSGPLLKPDDYLQQYGDGTDGVDYDDSKSFMTQFVQLYRTTPKMSQIHYGVNEGCDYAETVFGAKNGYLSVCIGQEAENILYSTMVYEHVKNVYNSVLITSHCENIYYCKLVTNSVNIFYSKYIHNSDNLRFCDNCIGCHECIGCSGLENQSYHIHNQPYSKEDYAREKDKILSQKHNYPQLYSSVSNIVTNKLAVNCSGSGIQFCEGVEQGYLISRFTKGRNIAFADGTPLSQRVYDCFDIGHCDDTCAWMGCGQGCDNMYCGANASACSHIYYCYFMGNCSFCLGCIGLKNKSYCILNKQYSKEERYQKVDEIFTQMEADGTLGEFFPAKMNPFYFNDTAAYLIDPSFSREEVTTKGYLRRDEPIKIDIPEGAEIVKTDELGQYEGWKDERGKFTSLSVIARNEDTSDAATEESAFGVIQNTEMWKLDRHAPLAMTGARYIDPSIIKKIIQDPEGNIYKVVPMEYEFLMKHGLPLPRQHWLDRMRENFRIE